MCILIRFDRIKITKFAIVARANRLETIENCILNVFAALTTIINKQQIIKKNNRNQSQSFPNGESSNVETIKQKRRVYRLHLWSEKCGMRQRQREMRVEEGMRVRQRQLLQNFSNLILSQLISANFLLLTMHELWNVSQVTHGNPRSLSCFE